MTIKKIGLLAALALAPIGAQAATVIPGLGEPTIGTFDVLAADSARAGQPISLWFADILGQGLSRTYTLTSPGSFVADAMGAIMTGSVVNALNANAGFDFSFTYDRTFTDSFEFKNVFGDATEHGNEDFFDFEGGTITGTGEFAGLVLEMMRNPVPDGVTQTGGGITDDIAANQHTSNFGLSGWMLIESVSADFENCTICFDDGFYEGLIGGQSDVNVDLSPAIAPTSVPVPAAGLLLMTALGGFGAFARRRRKS